MTIPLDPRFIPAFSIEDVILDKDTGQPLSAGLVYFEQDNQRGILKPIYQISGTSPNYTFTQLPNPMTLSSIGTFVDSLDNPVIPYFYPYNGNGDVELYYIRVTDSMDVPQFVREAQPYIGVQQSSDVLNVITNEVSNPQFIEVLFDTSSGSYTYNVNTVTNSVINVAPDWDLIVSAPGVGSVTLTQLTPTGSLNLLTNPGTLLTISSAGLTKLQLRQRILGSPNLWGSGYLSASFVAKTYSGTGVTLNMYYSQSNGTVVDQLLVAGQLPASGAYVAKAGSALIPASNSSQTYPNAYIDIYFDIPLSIQIDITSVMLAFTGGTSIDEIGYDQESLARQIDHLYHYAYPIIPIGGLMDFAGFADPLHYYLCDGTAKGRVQDYKLFTALTKVVSVTLTSAVATFTPASLTDYHIGMALESTAIPAATTVSGINTSTGVVTMSAAATATGAASVRLFAWGAGDGATTFNTPNLLGYTTAAANGNLFYTTVPGDIANGVGLKGGESKHQLTIAELAAHTHHTASSAGALAENATTAGRVSPNDVGTSSATGGDQPHNNIQLTALVKKYIRYQ